MVGPSGGDQAKNRPSGLRTAVFPITGWLLLNHDPIRRGSDAIFVDRCAGGDQSANGRGRALGSLRPIRLFPMAVAPLARSQEVAAAIEGGLPKFISTLGERFERGPSDVRLARLRRLTRLFDIAPTTIRLLLTSKPLDARGDYAVNDFCFARQESVPQNCPA